MKSIMMLLICLVVVAGCTTTETRESAEVETSTTTTGNAESAGSASTTSNHVKDVSGPWRLDVVTDLGSGTATFVFRQAGGMLTGEYDGMFGHLPVSGYIEEDKIEFSIIAQAGGEDATIAYSGTVEQDTINGTIDVGGQGSGTFVGKRK